MHQACHSQPAAEISALVRLSRSIAAHAVADDGGRHPVRPNYESATHALICSLGRRGECGKHE